MAEFRSTYAGTRRGKPVCGRDDACGTCDTSVFQLYRRKSRGICIDPDIDVQWDVLVPRTARWLSSEVVQRLSDWVVPILEGRNIPSRQDPK
jgi:hypothetical protein